MWGLLQVGSLQVGALQVGALLQVRGLQVGGLQVWGLLVGSLLVGSLQVGALLQVGCLLQVGGLLVWGLLQVGALLQVGGLLVGALLGGRASWSESNGCCSERRRRARYSWPLAPGPWPPGSERRRRRTVEPRPLWDLTLDCLGAAVGSGFGVQLGCCLAMRLSYSAAADDGVNALQKQL